MLCGLLITVDLPFLLVVESFIVKRFDKTLNNKTWKDRISMFIYTSFLKIKQLLY